MAKRPIAGRVKTRLGGALTGAEAASLYRAMLADRCAQVRALDGVAPAIAFAPGEPGDPSPEVPAGFVQVDQPDGGLGAGLAAAAAQFVDAATPVLLVDSDSPTLPLAYLQRAVERLRSADCDVVIGPADDGGYYLIGLSRPAPALFDDIPWSTAEVTGKTLARAAQLQLRVHQLPAWWDVDEPADLHRLEQQLFDVWWPTRTADWFRARRQGPVPDGAGSAALWREPWQRLSSRLVYQTPWLALREDQVRTPAGQDTSYSVIATGECVGVLPFVDDSTVLLIRQYRYVAQQVTWEMPTGGIHPGETAEQAARRELGEEARVSAEQLIGLGSYHTSKSVMDETAHLFIGRGLAPVTATADDTEFIRTEKVPFQRALDMVTSGEITDSMTIIAILRAALDS